MIINHEYDFIYIYIYNIIVYIYISHADSMIVSFFAPEPDRPGRAGLRPSSSKVADKGLALRIGCLHREATVHQ